MSALYDGNAITGLTVEGGAVRLPHAATIVTVGLPYAGMIETLPLVLGQANHAKRQMIGRVVIRTDLTRGLAAGPGGGEVFDLKQRQGEPIGDPIALRTGDFDCPMSARWNDGATVVVKQGFPLPATISAIFPEPQVPE